ncbi:MAG: serine/threonine protein kinase, partial [Myxococcales bacterium]|nr:serine/threonine protein kinase [Myxococcales bacterium]
MAEVYRARSSGAAGFEKIVAIKRVLPHIASDQEFTSMFVEEARICANLTHANIAQVFEFGRIDGAYFIAMEYVHGKDLREIQEQFKGKHVPLPFAIHVVTHVCSALEYAHSRQDSAGNRLKIVHCDVSPHNVLISFEGAVKLIDFGIARATTLAKPRDASNLEGKYAYMSPEQVAGEQLDARSDVFSAGTILYECITGRRLFDGPNEPAIIEAVRRAEVPPPSSINRGVPRKLDEIVLKALARDRDERFQRAEDLQSELERFAQASRLMFSSKQLSRWMKTTFASELSHGAGASSGAGVSMGQAI